MVSFLDILPAFIFDIAWISIHIIISTCQQFSVQECRTFKYLETLQTVIIPVSIHHRYIKFKSKDQIGDGRQDGERRQKNDEYVSEGIKMKY